MFSGIIEKKAKILKIENGRFTIKNPFLENLSVGQSIAHDGACMTIEKFDKEKYTFFSMEETLKKTNFSSKKIGDYFNLERSLKLGDRIDGHFVSGHIDSVGEISKIEQIKDKSKILTINFDKSFSNNIIEKGSVGVNGVSLTLFETKKESFKVSLIPITQKITNLGDLRLGDKINLEFDLLGKYILKETLQNSSKSKNNPYHKKLCPIIN